MTTQIGATYLAELELTLKRLSNTNSSLTDKLVEALHENTRLVSEYSILTHRYQTLAAKLGNKAVDWSNGSSPFAEKAPQLPVPDTSIQDYWRYIQDAHPNKNIPADATKGTNGLAQLQSTFDQRLILFDEPRPSQPNSPSPTASKAPGSLNGSSMNGGYAKAAALGLQRNGSMTPTPTSVGPPPGLGFPPAVPTGSQPVSPRETKKPENGVIVRPKPTVMPGNTVLGRERIYLPARVRPRCQFCCLCLFIDHISHDCKEPMFPEMVTLTRYGWRFNERQDRNICFLWNTKGCPSENTGRRCGNIHACPLCADGMDADKEGGEGSHRAWQCEKPLKLLAIDVKPHGEHKPMAENKAATDSKVSNDTKAPSEGKAASTWM